ncbi:MULTISPECIES: DUF2231 domain-containing protein [unclassified Micromonospora]|uniref:DUF2231 domain-containing protein n=1 Tax=unclassified Micromonospora TaxID=2617518 RepID=UPI003A894A59
MQAQLRVPGQPIQPMLVTLPFGLFVCAALFDISVLAGAPDLFGEVGYWTLVAGLAAMALTVAVGLVDLWDEPSGPVRTSLVRFNLISTAMGGMFLLAGLIRTSGPTSLAGVPLLIVELVGLGVGVAGLRHGTALLRHVGEVAAADERGRRSDGLDALARR